MIELVWNLWPIWVILAMILAGWYLARQLAGREVTPYERRKRLVTRSELAFFRVLREVVNNDWEIFAMVRIADLLTIPRGTEKHRSWLNRILSKHIDFVICDSDTLEVLVAIELDDASHQQAARIERDRFVNAAFADAGLPLLRVPVADSYDAGSLRKDIERAMA